MFELSPTANQFLKKYSTYFFLFIGAMAVAQPWLPILQTIVSPKVYGSLLGLAALAGILATQLKQAGITPEPVVVKE